MKTMNLKNIIAAFSMIMLIGVTQTFATPNEEKVVEKAREAIENAAPDDWHTYAKSAEMCMRKKTNLKEVAEWLDKSIEIKETVLNLSLKGDYYKLNRLPDEALKYYIKAMSVAKANDNNADVTVLQKKISDITKIGG